LKFNNGLLGNVQELTFNNLEPMPHIPTIINANSRVTFISGMVIDADGSPRAYAPHGSHLPALDYLANAMSGDKFVGVVCTPQGEPIIQGPNNPCPGYYVSPTSLCDKTKGLADPSRYVDSEIVPYIAICPELRSRGVALGDIALVTYHKKKIGAIVADIAPHNHYGEASIACAVALGIPSSAKNGGVSSGVVYVIFPGSRNNPAWPRDLSDIQTTAGVLFEKTAL